MAKAKRKKPTPTKATVTRRKARARSPKATTKTTKNAPSGKPDKRQTGRGEPSPGPKPTSKTAAKVKKPARGVKPKKPAKKARPTKPARQPRSPRLPRLSAHPEAIRSRKRRGLTKEQKRKASERARKGAEKKRQKRALARPQPDLRELAHGWLEAIRDRIAEIFGVTLDITYPGGGAADLSDSDRAREYAQSPWLIVGRFDPTEEIDYALLARALDWLSQDVLLEAQIHPDRLTQLRIVFHDPKSPRRESDSVQSFIGAYGFVLGDAIGDLVGASIDSPTEGSLAARYQDTTVPMFYIFFSSEMVRHTTAAPWAKTQEVKLR